MNSGNLFRHRVAWIIFVAYLVLLVYWISIFISGSTEGFSNNLFGVLYPFISLIGGLYGIFVVSKNGEDITA